MVRPRLTIFVCAAATVFGGGIRADADTPPHRAVRVPIAFEANEGQTDARAKFVARTPAFSLFLAEDAAIVGSARGGVRLAFQGANKRSTLVPLDRMSGGTNYLIG